MANSVIKNREPQVRVVYWSYSLPANESGNTNLYALINGDLPSGYRFGGLAGFTTNSIYVNICNLKYTDTSYSLQIANRANTAQSRSVEVYYIAIPN